MSASFLGVPEVVVLVLRNLLSRTKAETQGLGFRVILAMRVLATHVSLRPLLSHFLD